MKFNIIFQDLYKKQLNFSHILTQIKFFLQQLKQCPTKGKKKKLVTHNQECK